MARVGSTDLPRRWSSCTNADKWTGLRRLGTDEGSGHEASALHDSHDPLLSEQHSDISQGVSFHEQQAGIRYFQGIYADRAVSESCVSCHNNHTNSPRRDYKLNDIMGGVIVTIPITEIP